MIRPPPTSTPSDPLFPYPTLFRSRRSPPPLLPGIGLDHHAPDDGHRSLRPLLRGRRSPEAPEGPGDRQRGAHQRLHAVGLRSEEHTSELQSLMRISYAVFCLKKKKHNSYSKQRCTTILNIQD